MEVLHWLSKSLKQNNTWKWWNYYVITLQRQNVKSQSLPNQINDFLIFSPRRQIAKIWSGGGGNPNWWKVETCIQKVRKFLYKVYCLMPVVPKSAKTHISHHNRNLNNFEIKLDHFRHVSPVTHFYHSDSPKRKKHITRFYHPVCVCGGGVSPGWYEISIICHPPSITRNHRVIQ